MSLFAAAEARIRQLHADYTDAVWRKDAAAFGRCFAPDGEWRIAGMVLQGRDEIADTFARIMANANRVLITFRTPQLEITGTGRGIGRVYVTEQCTWVDKAPNTTIGRYYERYAESGGRWHFTWRLFELHYKGPADLTGEFFDHPDYGAWPGMPPLDAAPAAVAGRPVDPPRD